MSTITVIKQASLFEEDLIQVSMFEAAEDIKSPVKYEWTSRMFGTFQYLENGSLNCLDKKACFELEAMTEMARQYKGANRIHKPMGLLFWQDCKNGLSHNWKND